MSFPRLAAAALSLAAVALVVAACGGSSSSSSSTSASPEGKPTTVSATEVSELGPVLVDSKGLTVYTFGKDQGTTSSCYGSCEGAWPPVTVHGAPTIGEGASSSEVGTTMRKDGTTQVTYAGHPLYTFVEDKSPGEANGVGVTAFGGEWNALNESGAAPSASSGETAGGGAY
jgi:predicted lipoprotein with Yx(FWY)xxD motif